MPTVEIQRQCKLMKKNSNIMVMKSNANAMVMSSNAICNASKTNGTNATVMEANEKECKYYNNAK